MSPEIVGRFLQTAVIFGSVRLRRNVCQYRGLSKLTMAVGLLLGHPIFISGAEVVVHVKSDNHVVYFLRCGTADSFNWSLSALLNQAFIYGGKLCGSNSSLEDV